MSDHTPQMPTPMSNGTETKSLKDDAKSNAAIPKSKSPNRKLQVAGVSDFDITQPIENFTTYRDALGKAQLTGQNWLEVSDEIYAFLTSGTRETPYIWVSGVQIFQAGTRKDEVTKDRMSADDRHALIMKEQRAQKEADEAAEFE